MDGVVLRKVRVGLGVPEVVDRDDLDLLVSPRLIKGAQNVAPDAPVAVDRDSDCHTNISH